VQPSPPHRPPQHYGFVRPGRDGVEEEQMDWVLALIWFLPGMLVVLALSAVAELVAGAVGMGFTNSIGDQP
jgi:hypothetical protein